MRIEKRRYTDIATLIRFVLVPKQYFYAKYIFVSHKQEIGPIYDSRYLPQTWTTRWFVLLRGRLKVVVYNNINNVILILTSI